MLTLLKTNPVLIYNYSICSEVNIYFFGSKYSTVFHSILDEETKIIWNLKNKIGNTFINVYLINLCTFELYIL